ncbi:histidine phosphatase family protein [Candidatus Daviesbacteria bacterium]|nr:histidine phosphatase family protein [Candidatus Daviesbacteria bacterium]
MTIYFVRHGQGEHNLKKLYSTPEFELTELGRKQAEDLAQRIQNLPIDLIVSSTFKRTRQTTEIINSKINQEVVYSDLAVEVKRPSEIEGGSWEDPKIIKIRELMNENFIRQDWHFSDEENFYDIKKRAEKFLEYLSALDKKHILVVSHINLIRMTVLVMMLGDSLTPEIFLHGYDFLQLSTSGLTILRKAQRSKNEYGLKKKSEWELVTWNDQSHLAD